MYWLDLINFINMYSSHQILLGNRTEFIDISIQLDDLSGYFSTFQLVLKLGDQISSE